MIKIVFSTLILCSIQATAQEVNNHGQVHMPLKFISKVEVFAGPSISFNYGNKFVENYKDENVQNKRQLKVGYTLGLGLAIL